MPDDRVGVGAHLVDVVRERAAALVSALRDGHPVRTTGGDADASLVAATRVLGADVLAPCTLLGHEPAAGDVALVRAAVVAFPVEAGSSVTSAWTHWGLRAALRSLERGASEVEPPTAAWVRDEPWPVLAHRLAGVAALAVPGWRSAPAAEAAERVPDVARGFVRAVRRRDWLQAAGTGRWLAVLGGVPDSLGLDAGLRFVAHLAAGDARVELQVAAARVIREAGA
ncbi:hypothetical protein ACWEFJ_14075 [Actinosynnema sp. NPDC004786]